MNVSRVLENRYRIESLLGKGGMGAVYRATDLRFSAPVAIKENQISTPESQKQFAREAELLYRLRHANLPRVIDHFSIPSQGQYLVMDYVEGQDLNQVIARQGPVAEAQALNWIGQVLDALEYLHGQEIIHRDVKPANVKITPQGRVYLVDFGLAKVYDPGQETTLGARGVTPGYAPPEQYGVGRTDARADVYSVGATLYALLTGQAPPDAMEFVTGDAQLVPPRQVDPGISPQVEAGILRAMQIRPTDRFQTASEFHAALPHALRSDPAQPETPMDPIPPPGDAWIKVEPAPTLEPTVQASVARSQPALPESRSRGAAVSAAESPPAYAPALPPSAPAQHRQRRKRLPAWFWLLIVGAVALLVLIVVATSALLGGWYVSGEPVAAQPTAVIALPTRTSAPPPAPTGAERDSEPAIPEESPSEGSAGPHLPPPDLVEPREMAEVQGEVIFAWEYRPGLDPSQAFQLLIWRPGMYEPQPAGELLREREQAINLDELPRVREAGPGEYLWTVVVVDVDTHEQLSREAPPRPLMYTGPRPAGQRRDFPAPVLIHPPPGAEVRGTITFGWEWPHPDLDEGLFFDLRLWALPHQEELPMEAKPRATDPTRRSAIEVDLDQVPAIREHGPGEYAWTVVVVTVPCPGCEPEVVGEWGEVWPLLYPGP